MKKPNDQVYAVMELITKLRPCFKYIIPKTTIRVTYPERLDRVCSLIQYAKLNLPYESRYNDIFDRLSQIQLDLAQRRIMTLPCKRCGYHWESRTAKPKECPECHSRKWDKE
jgi:predicted Zn-ribbon and HTH transcriptional regulator